MLCYLFQFITNIQHFDLNNMNNWRKEVTQESRPKSSLGYSKDKQVIKKNNNSFSSKQCRIQPKQIQKIKQLRDKFSPYHHNFRYLPKNNKKKTLQKDNNQALFDKKIKVNSKITVKKQGNTKTQIQLKVTMSQTNLEQQKKKKTTNKKGISKSLIKPSDRNLQLKNDSIKDSKQTKTNKRSLSIQPITYQNSIYTSVNYSKMNPIIIQTSSRSKQGKLITNTSKPNQDSTLILTNFIKKRQTSHLFVVADGHGIDGHLVSQLLVNNIGKVLQKQLISSKAPKALSKSYDILQEMICNSSGDINVMNSGSTMVSVLIDDNEVICANVGDSRAILARQVNKKCWEVIYLSEDHKPELPKQKARILKKGGQIYPYKDEKGHPIGPFRVWVPNKNYQGLAMSRSMGDNISKPIGVTHQPQLIKVSLQEEDRFILIGSDGVWQFITNQEVLQLISPYYREDKLEQACDALLKLAYERWTVEDETVVDDISFILIFLGKCKN